MTDVFKALSDPTRRRILLMLAEEPNSINSISDHFNMSRPAVSKHIRILSDAQLLTIRSDETDGRQRNCYIQLEALKEVNDYIDTLERFWKSKLHGLGHYLSRKDSPS